MYVFFVLEYTFSKLRPHNHILGSEIRFNFSSRGPQTLHTKTPWVTWGYLKVPVRSGSAHDHNYSDQVPFSRYLKNLISANTCTTASTYVRRGVYGRFILKVW